MEIDKNGIKIALYSLCRNKDSINFVTKQGQGQKFTEINCISGLDYYQFLNKIIAECKYDFALVCHDDVTFEHNFSERIKKTIEVIDREVGSLSWGIVGNAGIEIVTHDIVRYIHDPRGRDIRDVFEEPVPLISIDGNTLLLNLKNLRSNNVSLPEYLSGFHMYDNILLMECYKNNLVCIAHGNLFVNHKSAGNQKCFSEFIKKEEVLNYLSNRFNDKIFYTINGKIRIDNENNLENNKLNFENLVFNSFEKIYKEKKQLVGKLYDKLRIKMDDEVRTLEEKVKIVQQKNQELSYLNLVTDDLNRQLQQKDQQLRHTEQELSSIRNSLIWRTFTYSYGIYARNVQCYVPKIIFRTIDFFLYRSGLRPSPANWNKTSDFSDMIPNLDKCRQFGKNGAISFKAVEKPDVSIIIPVFNKWKFTCGCLVSLYENIGEVPSCEVIVVDNASTDETSLIINQKFKNIRYFKNQKNLGFVGGCNFGAKQARGRYLVFLNNDTLIKKGWLDNLYKTFLKNNNIGLVGSKLIYPNETLQEAGGIIWKNKSAWNYGNGQNPDHYEFNYLKDVDYCSGASIMIPTSVFKRLGGFDEFYSPAYYEDTDLAFRVRKIGLRTVYQPKSELIHFEGGTAGKDIKQGLKKYQEINREKFFNRWADVLEKENEDEKNGSFLARDKSKNKKIFLYVDWRVPNFDKDAGSFIAFEYLLILKRLGYKIVFWADNLDKNEPYTEILQQMGIEVVYGNHSFRDFIINNGKFIDFAFLSRPNVSFSYMYLVKMYSQAKILYIAHDLHFLRELRSIEISNNKEEITNINTRKERELLMIGNADVSLFFSEDETKIVQNILPYAKTSVIPWIQEIADENPASFDNRKGIVFIGGFNHSPNVDAIKWFHDEIFPLVKKKLENVAVTIFGSHPSQEIMDLAGDDFKIVGFIEEEQVPVEFGKAKVFIAPLRFGAGFKGKIAKAMSNGLPVVTTDIGAEGIGLVDGENAMIANTFEEYAEKIVWLYTDEKLWKKLSENSIRHVKENFSVEKASRKMENIIRDIDEKNYDICFIKN
jgi:GT2 family glycosyltransferase